MKSHRGAQEASSKLLKRRLTRLLVSVSSISSKDTSDLIRTLRVGCIARRYSFKLYFLAPPPFVYLINIDVGSIRLQFIRRPVPSIGGIDRLREIRRTGRRLFRQSYKFKREWNIVHHVWMTWISHLCYGSWDCPFW